MGILLVEVPVAAVTLDDAFPDGDHSHILEHLVRYCATFDTLPAIDISIDGNVARVTRNHKYLIAARLLGRPTIRAVVTSPPSRDDVKRFVSRDDVIVLDWEAIKAKEALDRTPKGWHVFFFERSLSAEDKRIFEEETRSLFADPTIRVLYDDRAAIAEFEAHTPVTDEAWMRQNLGVFTRFHREQVPIVSYQGLRFRGWVA